jgi:dephospho-CoA kinase
VISKLCGAGDKSSDNFFPITNIFNSIMSMFINKWDRMPYLAGMKIVGLTGGISTGKSTCSRYFNSRQIAVIGYKHKYLIIDADAISRQARDIGTPTYYRIVGHFGLSVLNRDGSINPEVLGNEIFGNEKQRCCYFLMYRLVLNSLTHPTILLRMLSQLLFHFLSCSSMVIVDMYLLSYLVPCYLNLI